jgi:hypothetical protein
MSKEERRSSLTSTTVTPNTIEPTDQVPTRAGHPHKELQIVVSRPIEGHKHALPSLELDTIDR